MDTNPFTTAPLAATTQLLLRAAPRRAWLALLIVTAAALVLMAAGLFGRYVRQTLAEAQPIIIVSTPTVAPARAAVVPTAAMMMQYVGYFDYGDPATATPFDAARVACVVGTAEAGAWQLVALDTCDLAAPRLWLAAGLLPANTPRASEADLTPRTAVPAPALASEPSYRTYQAPAEQPPEPAATAAPPELAIPPAATPEPPIFVLPDARDFGPGSRSGGSWECNNPAGC